MSHKVHYDVGSRVYVLPRDRFWTPAKVLELLREVRETERARMPEQLERFGRDLGLSDGELRRVRRGSREDRRQVMMDLTRRRAQQYVDRHGLPDGVPERRWRAMAGGSDEEFVRGYLRIRGKHRPNSGSSSNFACIAFSIFKISC